MQPAPRGLRPIAPAGIRPSGTEVPGHWDRSVRREPLGHSHGGAVARINLVHEDGARKPLGDHGAGHKLRRGLVERGAAHQAAEGVGAVHGLGHRAAEPGGAHHEHRRPRPLRHHGLPGGVGLERQPLGAVGLHEHVIGRRRQRGDAAGGLRELVALSRRAHAHRPVALEGPGHLVGRGVAQARHAVEGQYARGRGEHRRAGERPGEMGEERRLAAAPHHRRDARCRSKEVKNIHLVAPHGVW